MTNKERAINLTHGFINNAQFATRLVRERLSPDPVPINLPRVEQQKVKLFTNIKK